MFEVLQIRNFQAHAKTKIEFSPSITTIVGDNDAGKSAVVRALRWVCTNKAPANFITHGEKSAAVRLSFDGGQKLVREYKSRSNIYLLNENEPYRAFGRDVPEEIQNALQLVPESFQGQHDGSFWFHLSPGQVAKELNTIINLEIIDSTLSNLNKRLSQERTALDVADERVSDATVRLNELQHVPAMYENLKVLLNAEQTAADTNAQRDKLAQSMADAKTAHDAANLAAERRDSGVVVVQAGQAATDLRDKHKRLADHLSELGQTHKTKNAVIPDTEPLRNAQNHFIETNAKWDRLSKLLHNAKRTHEKHQQCKQDLTAAKNELGDIKLCPTCERPL